MLKTTVGLLLLLLINTTLLAGYTRSIGCWTQQGKAVFELMIDDKKWLAEFSLNNKLFPKIETKYYRTTISKKTGNKFDWYKNEKNNIQYVFQRSVMKGQYNTLEVYAKGRGSTKYLCQDLK